MSLDEERAPSLANVDLQCPDCAAVLTGCDEPRMTTDGGDEPPRPDPDGAAGLRGVDVRCDCCGTELGVYFLP